ncbi:biopolymer transporter ExbD [Polaribacter filamentus]|uniref:Biopolymer transporter ExbD n=1 Tax=Polaribacter filamentus TaxID=53483 RepID=A0A2S7L018_9FLAO|nr:biopolymer transporter ExbD [Polaribacter filamentus]PQB08217.1 biopolymer transporter ExbD [Polaribacter filamentus]
MARRENPEINAGSMADIAFLLLIFFLVTTTMNVDSGVSKKLSEKPPPDYVPPIIKEKNIFIVLINRNNELLVEDQRMDINDLKAAAMDFIDNGGGIGNAEEDGTPGKDCDYCEGERSDSSSDHPNKAIISVQSDRGTEYGTYIKVQNELLRAYTDLRNRLSKKRYNVSYDELEEAYDSDKTNEALKKKVEDIKTSYPQIISDAEPTS